MTLIQKNGWIQIEAENHSNVMQPRIWQRVHQDVATLQLAGLLVRDGRKLTAPWD